MPLEHEYRTEHVKTLPNGFEVHRVLSIQGPKLEEWRALRLEGNQRDSQRDRDERQLASGKSTLFVAHAPDGRMAAYSFGDLDTWDGQPCLSIGMSKTRMPDTRKGLARELLDAHVAWGMAQPGVNQVYFSGTTKEGILFLNKVRPLVHAWAERQKWTVNKQREHIAGSSFLLERP